LALKWLPGLASDEQAGILIGAGLSMLLVGRAYQILMLIPTIPTTHALTQTLILDADPECQHVNVVNATLR
jgi:hypothetical protein